MTSSDKPAASARGRREPGQDQYVELRTETSAHTPVIAPSEPLQRVALTRIVR